MALQPVEDIVGSGLYATYHDETEQGLATGSEIRNVKSS